MARRRKDEQRLDAPVERGRFSAENEPFRKERFGRFTETIARGMGTPWFLLALTIVVLLWLTWNTAAPEALRFDSAALGFTALTLILSLQASYAAPMILLAQNRQDDRDRVQMEQDRQRADRNIADTEFLAREVVSLRLAMQELPDREFVRNELRGLLEDFLATEAQERHKSGSAGDTSADEQASGESKTSA
jgi:uncharacterized membrane protein